MGRSDRERAQESAPAEIARQDGSGGTPDGRAEVVRRLARAGYSPVTLAIALGLAPDDVLELLPVEERARWVATEEAVRDASRYVAWRAMQRALEMLDHGGPQTALGVIKALAPQIARQMTGESEDSALANLRADFERLLRGEG